MMYVEKRDGRKEPVSFVKITHRIEKLAYGLNAAVDVKRIAQKVISGVYDGVKTLELDELAAETAAHMSIVHEDYAKLAARIAVSNLHKSTRKCFSEVMETMYAYQDTDSGDEAPCLSKEFIAHVRKHRDQLDAAVVHARDYEYDYFGFKTLERAYLMKLNGRIVERPQHMIMRVAVAIHSDDVEGALESYRLMSKGFFTHASPTLFHAGCPRPGLSSCFLLRMKGDSISGIFHTMRDCALISKSAGGIGVNIHEIRASGTYIRGTGGTSNGLVPMLRVMNNTARYVDQGGGRRKGAFAIYLEPWHADIFEFLDLKKNQGIEEERARDLFYALWVPDLFMKRLKEDGVWSLMCPRKCPGLADVYGEEFETLYAKYETEGRFNRQVKAMELYEAILSTQWETGMPYMLYKDHVNRKSNQKNLGTIRSSNLCTEIMEYTDHDESAVCNLASIALPRFVRGSRHQAGEVPEINAPGLQNTPESKFPGGLFDHQSLFEVTRVVTRNLNKVIDINYYPTPETQRSNLRHRPVGIGVQGLADVFQLLNLPYESKAAQALNKEIFETMYFAALTASCELAELYGSYETFPGSPASQGILQYDMWEVKPTGRWNFDALKDRIKAKGLRNSLLIAPMPTASTSQILGNTESFEPRSSNCYVRRTLAGEFLVINTFLMQDLRRMGMWNAQMRDMIVCEKGNLQSLPVPDSIKQLYKTVWDMKGKTLINMSRDRGAFICQSQSFNAHISDAKNSVLGHYHMYCWEQGLKTGMYYLRTQETQSAQQVTISPELIANLKDTHQDIVGQPVPPHADTDESDGSNEDWMEEEERPSNTVEETHVDIEQWRADREHLKAKMMCSIENKEECQMCGS